MLDPPAVDPHQQWIRQRQQAGKRHLDGSQARETIGVIRPQSRLDVEAEQLHARLSDAGQQRAPDPAQADIELGCPDLPETPKLDQRAGLVGCKRRLFRPGGAKPERRDERISTASKIAPSGSPRRIARAIASAGMPSARSPPMTSSSCIGGSSGPVTSAS
jgi:hypothetical protein